MYQVLTGDKFWNFQGRGSIHGQRSRWGHMGRSAWWEQSCNRVLRNGTNRGGQEGLPSAQTGVPRLLDLQEATVKRTMMTFVKRLSRLLDWLYILWGWRMESQLVQFSSVTQSCPTLYNPMNRSTPGFPVHHQLPEFTEGICRTWSPEIR